MRCAAFAAVYLCVSSSCVACISGGENYTMTSRRLTTYPTKSLLTIEGPILRVDGSLLNVFDELHWMEEQLHLYAGFSLSLMFVVAMIVLVCLCVMMLPYCEVSRRDSKGV